MENKINKMKDKTKEFWENNKDIIIGFTCGIFVGATITIVFWAGNNNKKNKIIENQSKTIKELKNICKAKDNLNCRAISDGLRHGSPYAGKQMNYRKQQLRKVA